MKETRDRRSGESVEDYLALLEADIRGNRRQQEQLEEERRTLQARVNKLRAEHMTFSYDELLLIKQLFAANVSGKRLGEDGTTLDRALTQLHIKINGAWKE